MALTQISTDGIKNGTITGSDLATNVDLVDDQKLRIGTGNDLEFFHNGTRSEIKNSNVNNFTIRQGFGGNGFMFVHADKLQLRSHSTNHQYVSCYNNGQVEIYHANSKTFETSSTGATVTGTLIADGLTVGDAERIKLGNDGDLELYHTGTETFIKNSTGTLNINNDGVTQIKNYADDEFIAKFTSGGSVELYDANSKKFETHSGGVSVLGNLSLTNADSYELRLGAGSDLKLFHDGTDSRITNTTGALQITGNNDLRFKTNSGQNILKATGTAVELYYDAGSGSVKHFETNSGGVKVNDSKYMAFGNHNDLQISHDGSNSLINVTGTGTLRIQEDGSNQWEFNGANFKGNDQRKVILGDSSDLQLYHDGHSIIKNTNSSAAFLISSHATHIVNAAVTENIAKFMEGNLGVELYYSNSLKFRTVSNGIESAGHVRPLPSRDNTDDLGGSSQRWDDIFATNTTIQTSDEKEKENITDTDLGLDFINKLKPISFKFKGKTRTHYGLIAQDIERVITDLGKTTTQFAPLIKNTLEDGTERYGLRYTELLSPLIKAVQELSAEVAVLKAS